MPKLNRVLLVDDSRADNFLHKTILTKSGVCDIIDIATGGQQALDYLVTQDEAGNYPNPDLIFLDINMPGMNGWEFLEQYEKLPRAQKGREVIVMLTTSLNPSDRKKAEEIASISHFENKPLLASKIQEIVTNYFNN